MTSARARLAPRSATRISAKRSGAEVQRLAGVSRRLMSRVEGGGESAERPLLPDLPRCCHEACEGGARQRAAHAHPTDAERTQLGDVREVPRHEHIDRSRRDRVHDGADVFCAAQAGRVDAVCSDGSEGGQPTNRLRKIGSAHDEAFRTRGEEDSRATRVDGPARGGDASDGKLE